MAIEFVDVHCHLLDGLDDGPRSAEESLRLCLQSRAEGCRLALATVHQRGSHPNNDRARILDAAARLRGLLKARSVALEVLPNGEWLIDSDWFEQAEPLAGLMTVADQGRYALLEFPGQFPHHTELIVERLRPLGLRGIIAHVDRYAELLFDPVQTAYAIEEGFVIQMNSDAIDGRLGEERQREAKRLIQSGLVHLVASDGHRPEERPIRLRDAYRLVREWTDEATADLLFALNPTAIVDGEEPIAPKRVSALRRWWKR